MKRAILFVTFLFSSHSLFATTTVNYSGKSITISPVVCRELYDEQGRNVQMRVEGGYHNNDITERLELVLPMSAEMKKNGEGKLHMVDPEIEGTVCLRAMQDPSSSTPIQTFCISRAKGDDFCDVKYTYTGNKFKASLSCQHLRRSSNPKLPERLDLTVPESAPIECEIITQPMPRGPVVSR